MIAPLIGISIPLALVLYNPQPESDPGLAKIGGIDIGARTAYLKAVGNVAFVINQNEPTPGGLVLTNVSDPANPSELSPSRNA